jgi:hypothetical protein
MSDAATPASIEGITSGETASPLPCWSQAPAQAINPPAGLPASGERALVPGCVSYDVAAGYAWLREQGGRGAWG